MRLRGERRKNGFEIEEEKEGFSFDPQGKEKHKRSEIIIMKGESKGKEGRNMKEREKKNNEMSTKECSAMK